MFISCRSLLQWNITELITYQQVLPFHSYIRNEFFPMTSSFVSIALSLILSHLLYLSFWLQDTVKCMEVVLFQGCPRTLNSFTSCSEKYGSMTIPNIGWSRAVLSVSVVDGVWSCMCITGALAQRLIPRSVFLIAATELLPWTAIPTTVFVFFLLKLNKKQKRIWLLPLVGLLIS